MGASPRPGAIGWPLTGEATGLVLALAVYLAVRLIGLADYPIYFFTDEAVQTVRAAEFVRDGFRDGSGTLFPTYFRNGFYLNLSASVYWQIVPYLLFGTSVFVTRAAAVLATLMAALAVHVSLREVFRVRYAWTGVLILSATPAWFLHSRTAFETALMVSFWAPALCFYLLYRCRDPRFLFPAIGCAALSFYAYAPGQVVVVVAAALLALVDAPYHWRHRRIVAAGIVLVAILALPLLRFQLAQGDAVGQLSILSSYWTEPLALSDKLLRYAAEYRTALDPRYWFTTSTADIARHRMGPHPHLSLAAAPFLLLGLVLAVWRSWASRPTGRFVAALAAPAGAALVAIGVTRVLSFVVPATILTSIGLSAAIGLATRVVPPLRTRVGALATGVTLFALLAAMNMALLREALVDGPTWSSNYGLSGMQYGARQVFGAVQEELALRPGEAIVVSPVWTNGTDVVATFFLGNPLPIRFAGVGDVLKRKDALDGTLYVLTAEDMAAVRASGKFSAIEVERTLPWPDGRPGFYFVRLRYVDDIDAIFAAEAEARRRLIVEPASSNGIPVTVSHSALDMGSITDLFDGDPKTLVRGAEANPLVVDVQLSTPLRVSTVELRIAAGPQRAEVSLVAPGGKTTRLQGNVVGSPSQQSLLLATPEAVLVSRVTVSLQSLDQGETGHVHLYEIELR